MTIFTKRSFWKFYFFCFIFAVLVLINLFSLDPDFGWHIRMGNYILFHGISATDPLSYTMPSFPFVDHEWLTNIFFALIYPKIGIFGIYVLFSSITTLALFICIKLSRYRGVDRLFFAVLLLVTNSLIFFQSARPLIFSWLFFIVLFSVLTHFAKFGKKVFFLPFLFLLWANMHAGFAIGIVLFFVYILTESIEKKKIAMVPFYIFFVSLFTTLINPYGIRLWGEVWMQVSDGGLHSSIVEWQSVLAFPQFLSIWFLLVISFIGILLFGKKYSLFRKVTYFLLLFLGVVSVRHMPFFILSTFPLVLDQVHDILQILTSQQQGVRRIKTFQTAFFSMCFIIVCMEAILNFESKFQTQIQTSFYPTGATQYLKHNMPRGNIFSLYDWGGYLDWKLPEKKVFIDGRMPSWRWTIKNRPLESANAFRDYIKIFNGTISLKKIIAQYNIDTFLLRSNDAKDNLQKNLLLLGFKQVYRDTTSVILEKQ